MHVTDSSISIQESYKYLNFRKLDRFSNKSSPTFSSKPPAHLVYIAFRITKERDLA